MKPQMFFMRLYGFLAVIILWYGLSVILGEQLIPLPHLVASVFWQRLIDGTLLLHGGMSLLRLVAGILLALLSGVPLGILAGTSIRGDGLVTPVVYVLYPLPKIAFLPVFIVLFGLGNLSKILLLLSVLFFQVILAARDGVKSIPTALLLAAKSLDLNRRERFFKIYLPSALPRLFSALRVSIGIGIAVLFFAENYATTWGLGYYVMNAWVMIDYPLMFAAIAALGIIAAALMALLDLLQKRFFPWIDEGFTGGE